MIYISNFLYKQEKKTKKKKITTDKKLDNHEDEDVILAQGLKL